MKKTLTIYQTDSDSIDVLNQLQIEVWYNEGKQSQTQEPNTPEEITSIEYEGIEVSHLICTMFSDEEILNAQTDLSTEKELVVIKKLNQIEQ